MKPVVFHPDAVAELAATVEWYDAHRVGLGRRFAAEVARVTRRIAEYPASGRRLGGSRRSVRRLPLTGFPYAILYRDGGELIRVLAVSHGHRRPGYWRNRTSPPSPPRPR